MRTDVHRDLLGLLLHPVRIRILHAFSGGGARTTSELCARLPDVSQATVYRHVAALARAGVLGSAGETPVRGAIERTYEIDRARAFIREESAAKMDRASHRQAFAAAVGAMVADFGAYLEHPSADPATDLVGYRQIPFWSSPRELRALIREFNRVIEPVLKRRPTKGRRQYLLSPVFFPVVSDGSERRRPRKPPKVRRRVEA